MSRRIEYLSPEGLRVDGRRQHETRRIKCKTGVITRADGSAYYEQGNTRVLCTVHGPREPTQRSKVQHDKAFLNCEFSLAPFSAGERLVRSKHDRRSAETAQIVRQTFEAVVLLHLYPRTQIDIFFEVLQSDGGVLCACINAASLALIDAGVPMKDMCCACAASYVDEVPIIDLNYIEESAEAPNLPIAMMANTKEITLMEMDSRTPLDVFDKISEAAQSGCMQIYRILNSELHDTGVGLVEAQSAVL